MSIELIFASWGVGNQIMYEIYQRVHDGFGLLDEWAIRIVFPICKGRVTSETAAATKLRRLLSMV